MKLCISILVLVLITACGGSSPSSVAGSTPASKSEAFSIKSASDIRREIASSSAARKNITNLDQVPSTLYYTCDRETLPRTCCYYILNGGGGVYGGSPSCTEENH